LSTFTARSEPVVVSDETRRKLNATRKGKLYGPMSEEIKSKLSEVKKEGPGQLLVEQLRSFVKLEGL
jgi:hypothetical protein